MWGPRCRCPRLRASPTWATSLPGTARPARSSGRSKSSSRSGRVPWQRLEAWCSTARSKAISKPSTPRPARNSTSSRRRRASSETSPPMSMVASSTSRFCPASAAGQVSVLPPAWRVPPPAWAPLAAMLPCGITHRSAASSRCLHCPETERSLGALLLPISGLPRSGARLALVGEGRRGGACRGVGVSVRHAMSQAKDMPVRHVVVAVMLAAGPLVGGASVASADGSRDPAAVKNEGGKYYDKEGNPTFKVQSDGTVDWSTYSGFRRYHSDCHVCHGPDGEGSSYAPALSHVLKTMNYPDFANVIVNGRKNVNTA